MSELRSHRAQEGERLAPFARLTVRECEVLQDLIEGKNAGAHRERQLRVGRDRPIAHQVAARQARREQPARGRCRRAACRMDVTAHPARHPDLIAQSRILRMPRGATPMLAPSPSGLPETTGADDAIDWVMLAALAFWRHPATRSAGRGRRRRLMTDVAPRTTASPPAPRPTCSAAPGRSSPTRASHRVRPARRRAARRHPGPGPRAPGRPARDRQDRRRPAVGALDGDAGPDRDLRLLRALSPRAAGPAARARARLARPARRGRRARPGCVRSRRRWRSGRPRRGTDRGPARRGGVPPRASSTDPRLHLVQGSGLRTGMVELARIVSEHRDGPTALFVDYLQKIPVAGHARSTTTSAPRT